MCLVVHIINENDTSRTHFCPKHFYFKCSNIASSSPCILKYRAHKNKNTSLYDNNFYIVIVCLLYQTQYNLTKLHLIRNQQHVTFDEKSCRVMIMNQNNVIHKTLKNHPVLFLQCFFIIKYKPIKKLINFVDGSKFHGCVNLLINQATATERNKRKSF